VGLGVSGSSGGSSFSLKGVMSVFNCGVFCLSVCLSLFSEFIWASSCFSKCFCVFEGVSVLGVLVARLVFTLG
jgi:hypothetical protein